MAENIKLTTPDKKPVTDARYFEDYASADVCGKVKVGKLAVYYKDGLKRYCAPLEYIDRAFTRVNECNARTCCCANSYDYYRLILVHGEKEFANIIFDQDEKPVDEAERLLKERRPEIEIGYVKPEK
jgi:hypothetical protein